MFGTDPMDPMATDADRDLLVALRKEFSMLAHQILRILVGRDIRIETPHVGGVGVAGGAEERNLTAIHVALESFTGIHGAHLGIFRVTPMAIGAGKPPERMDVLRKIFHDLRMGIPEGAVALLTTVRCPHRRHEKKKEDG